MSFKSFRCLVGIAAIGALCSLPATAQMMGHSAAAQGVNNPNQNGMAGSMGPAQDDAFLKDAAAGNMGEVAMGKVALDKSSNDDVKKFAQRMVDDHGKMEGDVETVAKANGVNLPSSPDKGTKKEIAKLQTMSGADFDKAYMAFMVKDHKKDLAAFKSEAGSTQNGGVKDLAINGAKTIQSHLEEAESVNSKVSGK
jgi:putative membrane protein